MSRVLITGAAGFIGRHLATALVKEGHEVWGTRFRPHELRLWPAGLRSVVLRTMDVRDPRRVQAVVAEARPEIVYHTAGQAYPLLSWKDPIDTYRTNLLGTVHLFEALRNSPPTGGILLVSSGAIYGVQATLPILEDAPLLPSNPYGVSKAAQDLVANQYAKNFGLRILRARLFGTTGPGKLGDAPGDFASQVALVEAGMARSVRVGNLETRRDISDVRDVVRAFQTILARGSPELPVNVGSGQAYRIGDLLEILRAEARTPPPIEVDERLTRPTDEPVLYADTTRLRQLGFVPQYSIAETLRDSLQYWREHLAYLRPPHAPRPRAESPKKTRRMGPARTPVHPRRSKRSKKLKSGRPSARRRPRSPRVPRRSR